MYSWQTILKCTKGGSAEVTTAPARTLDIFREAIATQSAPAGDASRVSALRALCDQNPVNGAYWWRLAEDEFAAEKYSAAAAAFTKAHTLGFLPSPPTAVRAATAFECAGNRAEARAWAKRALEDGFRSVDELAVDPVLAPVVGELLEQGMPWTHRITAGRSDWSDDVHLLMREVRRRRPGMSRFDPEGITLFEFDQKAHALAERAERPDADAHGVELMRLIAQLGDGHSKVSWPERDGGSTLAHLPLRFYFFEDGCFIVGTAPEHKNLMGAKLEAIDGAPLSQVCATLEPLISRDNQYNLRSRLGALLQDARVLHGCGLTATSSEVELTISRYEDAGRFESIPVESQSLAAEPDNHVRCPPEWSFLPRTLDQTMPHYLRDLDTALWCDTEIAPATAYVQFNQVLRTLDGETQAIRGEVGRTQDLARVILDVRWNTGGNTLALAPLLRWLWSLQDDGVELFVLIGRRTFSAAGNFVCYLERFSRPIFVGEPTGARPNGLGDHAEFVLPNSGMKVAVSDVYWQGGWPMDERPWIAPHVFVPPRFADFCRNRDAALEFVLETEIGALAGIDELGNVFNPGYLGPLP